jgi:aspartate racemase
MAEEKMKRIGLIGGMSWESTAVYYRFINEAIRDRLGGLHSADIVLRSLDFAAIVALQRGDRWDDAARLLGDAASDLKAAGADFGVICTNTMHLVADEVAARSGLPLLDIVAQTGRAIAEKGCRRPLLLATRYTMEHGFYADRMRRHGIDVRVPDEAGRAAVHGIIFDELCRGVVSNASRLNLMSLIVDAAGCGADSVILGCTEICLILDADRLPLPGFDSTRIHATAAVDRSLEATPIPERLTELV